MHPGEEIHVEKHQLTGNVSGVYFLYHHDEVVYVGQGWNCLLRVAEHTRKESTIEFTSWSYIPIEGKQLRRNEEKRLIEEYQPRYNRQHRNRNPHRHNQLWHKEEKR